MHFTFSRYCFSNCTIHKADNRFAPTGHASMQCWCFIISIRMDTLIDIQHTWTGGSLTEFRFGLGFAIFNPPSIQFLFLRLQKQDKAFDCEQSSARVGQSMDFPHPLNLVLTPRRVVTLGLRNRMEFILLQNEQNNNGKCCHVQMSLNNSHRIGEDVLEEVLQALILSDHPFEDDLLSTTVMVDRWTLRHQCSHYHRYPIRWWSPLRQTSNNHQILVSLQRVSQVEYDFTRWYLAYLYVYSYKYIHAYTCLVSINVTD